MQIKGMVQVLGATYRVVRLRVGHYQVTRISDDVVVGEFACGQTLSIKAHAVDVTLMRQLAAAAVQRGKTSWMGYRAGETDRS